MKREVVVLALAVCSHGSLLLGARAFPERRVLAARMQPGAMAVFELQGPGTGGPLGPGARSGEAKLARAAEPVPHAAPGEAAREAAAESPPTEPEAVRSEAAPAVVAATPSAADPAPAEAVPATTSVAASAGEGAGASDGPGPSAALGDAAPATPPASDGFSDPSEEPTGSSLAGLLGPGLGGLGVAGRVAVAGAVAPAAPTAAPSAAAVDKAKANEVLSSTLVGQDRKKGIDLPATGVVTASVSDATRALPVAHNTRASFEVKLAPGGKVAGVRVMNASAGEAAAWEGAARAVATNLSSKALSLGEAAKSGATIVVSVTVKHVYPTGTAKATDVKPVCANQILNDIADAASDRATPTPEATVPLFQDENGRPCIPIGVGGTADAANLGATKQIQVQTSSKVLIGGKEALPETQAINKDPFWLPSTKEGPRPVAPYKLRKYKRDREKKK